MTPVGWLFVGLLCAVLAAYLLGYQAGRSEAQGEWWNRRRELLVRYGLLAMTRKDPW